MKHAMHDAVHGAQELAHEGRPSTVAVSNPNDKVWPEAETKIQL
jgi:hypothetical protein